MATELRLSKVCRVSVNSGRNLGISGIQWLQKSVFLNLF